VTVQLSLIPHELSAVPNEHASRRGRDRLELLAALLHGPTVEEIYHQVVIDFPRDHPDYSWGCTIPDCARPQVWMDGAKMCKEHYDNWLQARDSGVSRAKFNRTATPLEAARYGLLPDCQICPGRPVFNPRTTLCRRHLSRWTDHEDRIGGSFESWLANQRPFPRYGECKAVVCISPASTPLGLCTSHLNSYVNTDGAPGGAHLPDKWVRRLEDKGHPVPVLFDNATVFAEWCRTARSMRHNGEISFLGLAPLLTAELQWGLHTHAQKQSAPFWPLGWFRALVHYCRVHQVSCLDELDLDEDGVSHTDRMIVKEIRDALRLIYFSPQDSKEAGFIETDHFGRRLPYTNSYFDLNGVEVRWLRDLLWDAMAERLSSAQCPRTRKVFDGLRRGAVALSAFLVIDAPQGGQDPTLLGAEEMRRFVADIRQREGEGLPSLGYLRRDGKPAIVTEHTRRDVFNYGRRLLTDALASGETNRIGLDPAFIAPLPNGGDNKKISRNPFTDEVAAALVDETNLALLGIARFDTQDRGYRDIWEAIAFTGRRCSEVLNLRLDCIGHYNGLPMLWHDQTKVGNFNVGIRIPERLYETLDQRRNKTLVCFEHRHARRPSPKERTGMALFPTPAANSNGTRSLSYGNFLRHFRDWVNCLDLGNFVVPHQARHTLATKLLKHGATLTHIRQYLGQVSERMAEHYTKVAGSELDDILQVVWVAGPGTPNPGTLLSTDLTAPLDRHKALALAVNLSRSSTPAEGGFCTFQPVVDGGACPYKLDCENCDRFVMSGADLLYWRRKQEQWRSIAERAPDDVTADYLHKVFEPTALAIAGLEKALAGLGLLDDALALDLRRPQDYFHRVWNVGFLASDLKDVAEEADATDEDEENL
jgi:integrase